MSLLGRAHGIGKITRADSGNPEMRFARHVNDASVASFAGLAVCSLFLSLRYYEIFFYLLVVNNALWVLSSRTDNKTKSAFKRDAGGVGTSVIRGV